MLTDAEKEIFALRAFTYLLSQQEALDQFMSQSGMSANELRKGVDNLETLAAVMDFIMQDDGLLLEFCEEVNCTIEDIWRIRSELPGATVL